MSDPNHNNIVQHSAARGLVLKLLPVAGLVIVLGIAVMFLAPTRAQEGQMTLPSGLVVQAHEILWEAHPDLDEVWIVARFLAPEIARSNDEYSFDEIEGDFQMICAQVIAPLAANLGGADQVIVQIMDQIVPRGQTIPGATQFMNAFGLNSGGCIWE